MDERTAKAAQIAATTQLKRTTRGWVVPSQSSPTRAYLVASLISCIHELGLESPQFAAVG